MNHVFDLKEARAFSKWQSDPERQAAMALEHNLAKDLLRPYPGETILDIGCGTGASSIPFLEMGLKVTGIDASPYMLEIAFSKLKHRVDLYRGFAEDLPFEDNSFNYAYLNITLSFVDKPERCIEEACRVAKDKIYIGILNKYAIEGVKRRLTGIFTSSIFNHARFFSVWEITQMLHNLLGDVPVTWRTVCHLPVGPGRITRFFEENSILRRSPTGAYAGIVASLVPRFRTRPIAIKYKASGLMPTS